MMAGRVAAAPGTQEPCADRPGRAERRGDAEASRGRMGWE